MWVGIIPSVESKNKTRRWRKEAFSLSPWLLIRDINLLLPLNWDSQHHFTRFSDLHDPEPHHQPSWASSLQTSLLPYTSANSSLQETSLSSLCYRYFYWFGFFFFFFFFPGSVSTSKLLVKSDHTLDCACCHSFIPVPGLAISSHIFSILSHIRRHTDNANPQLAVILGKPDCSARN